jgi:serine/threonine-protein phosphatase 6 regulatory ankyrin repeat subunit A/serine/threonine-protein phosphatase 6 regulatory ankyrin repeat subunit B
LGTDTNYKRFSSDDTVLHHAASIGNVAVTEYLIINGANVNARGQSDRTPLHVAENAEVAKILLSHHAMVEPQTNTGETPLHIVAGRDIHTNIFPSLMPSPARDKAQATYVKKLQAIVEMLLSHGADVHKGTSNGYTPLHSAVRSNNVPIASLLIQHGADTNALSTLLKDSPVTEVSPLSLAKTVELCDLLVAHGAKVSIPESEPPLLSAAYQQNAEVVEFLLSHGADPNVKTIKGRAPALVLAARRAEIVKALLKRGADPNAKNQFGQTALHLAALWGEVDSATVLLSHGARIDEVDEDGRTPLHLTVGNGYAHVKEMTELLINNGANVNASDKRRATPFGLSRGKKDIAALLDAHGAHSY